jgi:hypothetical protein
VTLSIVSTDRVPFGYYAAKLAQEAAARGPASTILRATEFHEFPGQVISWTRDGSRASVFDLRVQTVAARTAAAVLVEVAEGPPAGRARDLAGPEEADLVALARRLVEHRGEAIEIEPDTESFGALPPRARLTDDDARLEGPTFEEWLRTEDAAALPLGG